MHLAGCPLKLRMDAGVENSTTANIHAFFRQNESMVLVGRSTANQVHLMTGSVLGLMIQLIYVHVSMAIWINKIKKGVLLYPPECYGLAAIMRPLP